MKRIHHPEFVRSMISPLKKLYRSAGGCFYQRFEQGSNSDEAELEL